MVAKIPPVRGGFQSLVQKDQLSDDLNSYVDSRCQPRLELFECPHKMILSLSSRKLLFISSALISAIGVPAVNSLVPWTDLNGWLKYFWPACQAEVTAVQKFFETKVKTLHEVYIIH